MDNYEKKDAGFFDSIQIEFLIHELKDPISIIETGIRTLVEKTDKYGQLTPKQEKTLNRVLRNTVRAREMLYGLLEIGRSEAGCFDCRHFHPSKALYEVLIDVVEIVAAEISDKCRECRNIAEAIKQLSENGIFLKIDPKAEKIELFQDETKFRQIIANLIRNALSYRKERLDIQMCEENGFIKIDIIDDGPGIEPQYHNLIFQRYAQVKSSESSSLQRKGHGLGLAGSLILARSLGGNISVDSRKGKGATFSLRLPLTI